MIAEYYSHKKKFNPRVDCGHRCECCGRYVTPHEVIDRKSLCCGANCVVENDYTEVYPLFDVWALED
jgi:methionyl-tRNA synthetase